MDLERTMTFIVKQQAKFEGDIARINETLNGINETARLHNEQAERNNKAIRDLVEVSRLQSERIDRLDQSLDESYKRLARSQEETDRRLKDFVAQVARYLAGGNGRGRGPKKSGTK